MDRDRQHSASSYREEILATAREHLFSLFGRGLPPTNILPLPWFARVNVTLRVAGQVRGSMSGYGGSFYSQLLDAVQRASADNRFAAKLVEADLERVSLEVWLQLSIEPIPLEARSSPAILSLGEDGVEVRQGSAFAYYKPSVALTSRVRNAQELFDRLCEKASLKPDAWKSEECALSRTRWLHIAQAHSGGACMLRSLRSVESALHSQTQFTEWAQSSLQYLSMNQGSDGSFCYKYLPLLDADRKEPANPVRAAGCAYALAWATADDRLSLNTGFHQSADRAVSAILKRAVAFGDGCVYISDAEQSEVGGKLGTTALLALALLSPVLRERYADRIESLIAAIKSAQTPDGALQCTFGARTGTEAQVNFFPGQALLALVVKASLGDDSCRDAYRAAFPVYRSHFEQQPTTAFLGWQVDVWSRAALLDRNAEYAEFAFSQLDWLLQFQLKESAVHTGIGGFSQDGKEPNYSSIVYTEALGRGAELAYRTNDSRFSLYKDAYLTGVAYCHRLTLREEQMVFCPSPRRAFGGTTISIANWEVRSDVVQHALTLALAAMDYEWLSDR